MDAVNKLNTSMSAVQKTTQDFSAASGARLDTMGTQVQGLSDNVGDLQARMGKLDQKLTDIQNTLQNVDSKLRLIRSAAAGPPPSTMMNGPGTARSEPAPAPAAWTAMQPAAPSSMPSGPPASADVLYSNALRDINGKHYDLATQEFQDYLKYYGETDLASNAQFYLGEVAFMQNQFQLALDSYNKVIENYPQQLQDRFGAHAKRLLPRRTWPEGLRRARTAHRRAPVSGHGRSQARRRQAARKWERRQAISLL